MGMLIYSFLIDFVWILLFNTVKILFFLKYLLSQGFFWRRFGSFFCIMSLLCVQNNGCGLDIFEHFGKGQTF